MWRGEFSRGVLTIQKPKKEKGTQELGGGSEGRFTS